MEAIGAVAGAGGFGALAGYAVRGRSASIFAPSVYHGDRSRRALALTFDDGPSESTPDLLELLERHHVKATFFMCGSNVRRLPGIAKMVAEAGHEIGNHTDTHPRFDFKSPELIYREMAQAQESISQITGVRPMFFRAPYGVRWFGLRRAQKRLDLTGVMWTVIGKDWILPADRVRERLLSGATNGGILCLHDGRATQVSPNVAAMLGAVAKAVPDLRGRGFTFLQLSEILGRIDRRYIAG